MLKINLTLTLTVTLTLTYTRQPRFDGLQKYWMERAHCRLAAADMRYVQRRTAAYLSRRAVTIRPAGRRCLAVVVRWWPDDQRGAHGRSTQVRSTASVGRSVALMIGVNRRARKTPRPPPPPPSRRDDQIDDVVVVYELATRGGTSARPPAGTTTYQYAVRWWWQL